jgi:hypothetical protein
MPAPKLEAYIWGTISRVLKDTDQLRADLDAMIELEHVKSAHDGSGDDTQQWMAMLAEADRKRARYQEMAAADLITFEELRARLIELDETRRIAERELKTLSDRQEHLNGLEQDRDALLDSLAEVAPDALDALNSQERHQLYRMLRLKVIANLDGSFEVSGAFGETLDLENLEEGLKLCTSDVSRYDAVPELL